MEPQTLKELQAEQQEDIWITTFNVVLAQRCSAADASNEADIAIKRFRAMKKEQANYEA